MPFHPSWPEIALRLAVTVLAGGILGANRVQRGHATGIRTTILVGLAACVAMIQANSLLATHGNAPDSFVRMDVMRLALGILTGVGFIGAGAILRKGPILTGVTTAATMWMTTAIGLAIGGGQVILGVVATTISAATLWSLKPIDNRIPRERHGTLTLRFQADEAVALDLNDMI
ncbi:MAG TPA: MgtC/SapB family protein, partial [Fimbriimonas sp.]|nr:MgtC/SapB family protein [Fimbriimonas sp.]